MNALIQWFATNKVAANLMMTVLLVAGALSLGVTGKELIPGISLDVLLINTAYPGASAAEVERVVTTRVEQALADIPSIKTMRSLSRPHLGIVSLEIARGFNLQNVRESVQKRLDAIIDWPNEVERPQVTQVAVQRDLVANLVLFGQADGAALKALAEKVKLELLDDTMVTQVEINQDQDYEMNIFLSEMALQRYALSFSEVASAIRRQTTDAVGGQLKVKGADGSILIKGGTLDIPALENLVVRSMPDGGQILLQDVAYVREGLAQSQSRVDFDGQRAIYLSVYRVGSQDILDVAHSVSEFAKLLQETLPEGISVTLWQNMARYYQSRIDMLKENAALGSVILFMVLLSFLNLRMSFWVSMGVPIAFMGAFWILPMAGGTLNMVSLFAFILVLGIVVDDAIIVGENIYTHQNFGRTGLNGAIYGAQQVARPVIFAALTTMVMFAPLLFLPGAEGKLVQIIPIVVIAVLAFSLIESLLILPAHLSTSHSVLDRLSWLNLTFISRAMEKIILYFYRPFLTLCLKWRLSVLAFFITCFILSLGLISTGWLKFTFFSPIAADTVKLTLKYAEGTDSKIIEQEIDYFAQIGKELGQEISKQLGEPLIEHVVAMYGQTPLKKDERLGTVILALVPSENRRFSGEALAKAWEKRIGDRYQAKKIQFESSLNENSPPIEIELLSRDFNKLQEAQQALKQALSEFEGVYGIRDNLERLREDIHLTTKPLANALGIKSSDLALQVRQAFHGVKVATMSRGDESVAVTLQYAPFSDELWRLENMLIVLADGSTVPLHVLADIHFENSPVEIHRSEGKRSIRVSAYVDPALAHEGEILKSLRADFLKNIDVRFHGVIWKSSGIQHSKKVFIADLLRGFTIAILIMYGLVATLFGSYFQPFIILFAVPFGLIGAILGHQLMGLELTLWSVVGITAVSGVVVNDNLVLVDAMNALKKRGFSDISAVVQACTNRFRPVVLTTLTTFGGLLPMMYETSVQAKFMVPMAVSLGYGVLFATIISLILVPATYLLGQDMSRFFGLKQPVMIRPKAK